MCMDWTPSLSGNGISGHGCTVSFNHNVRMVMTYSMLFSGLSCVCQPGTKIVSDFGGTELQCEECTSPRVTFK